VEKYHHSSKNKKHCSSVHKNHVLMWKRWYLTNKTLFYLACYWYKVFTCLKDVNSLLLGSIYCWRLYIVW
jgi:hypothetical protein